MGKGRSNQRGVALILLLVSLVVILGAIGFAIDSYMMTISKTQYQSGADATALAVLEKFYEVYDPNPIPGSLIDRAAVDAAMLEAVKTAQFTIQQHVDVLLTTNYLQNKSVTQHDVKAGSSGANGIIYPGRWITETGQIGAIGDKDPPYFVPYTGSNNFVPSAFRVEVNINAGSPIKTTLLHMVGYESYTLKAVATSITTARKGIFLMDLSPSIAETSHDNKPLDLDLTDGILPNCPREQALYSYPVKGACAEGSQIPNDSFIYDYKEDKLHNPIDPQSNPRSIFGCMNNDASNYRCVKVESSGDPFYEINNRRMEPSLTEYFAVDYGKEPQPLSDILSGIYYALDRFSKRDVGGDRVGVFGFDDREAGFLKVRSTLDGGAPGLTKSNSLEFQRMQCATRCPFPKKAGGGNCGDTYTPCSSPVAPNDKPTHLNRFLFPQYFSNNAPNAITESDPEYLNTNIKIALAQAKARILAEPDDESSENFIALFTDGKSNCKIVNTPVGPQYDCNGLSLDHHIAGINDVINYADQELRPSKINLHIMLAGDSVAPHTLIRKGLDPSTCLDDITSRLIISNNPGVDILNYLMVHEASAELAGKSKIPTPFYFPNLLYFAARATGGLWLPLRRPCYANVDLLKPGATGSTSCNTTTGDGCEGKLALACQNTSGFTGKTLTGTPPIAANPLLNFLNSNPLDGIPNQTDSAGRLLCDPHGRNISTQINEFIDIIMNVNPIRLVPNNN